MILFSENEKDDVTEKKFVAIKNYFNSECMQNSNKSNPVNPDKNPNNRNFGLTLCEHPGCWCNTTSIVCGCSDLDKEVILN